MGEREEGRKGERARERKGGERKRGLLGGIWWAIMFLTERKTGC